MISERIADVAVMIVGFRNPSDITACLVALAKSAVQPNFDVFICENGGIRWYQRLLEELVDAQGPCYGNDDFAIVDATNNSRFIHCRRLQLRNRSSNVWVGCAVGNLGYAGGINAWLNKLETLCGWKGVWVLNPDTEPEAYALAALVDRAEAGAKAMVGSTIIDVETRGEVVHCRGGLRWQRFSARTVAVGFGDFLNEQYDLSAIEAAMDSPSGASMYVTRQCIEKIGLMDESYFLFFEDLDWGLRAKAYGLGYASASIVKHKRGTTTGSAKSLATMPRLSVYLEHRNGVRIARRYFPWTLPLRVSVSLLYACRFLIERAPRNFLAALEGLLAGLRSEVGQPTRYHELAGRSCND